MAQDIVNNNQGISYTNLDFSSIYVEVLDLIKKLTYRWDPSISDESDPGVILVKLSALLADKCNYNIDKSVLETFPLSVTQDANARQLYEQLGYYMDWYEAASVPVVLNWSKTNDTLSTGAEVQGYTIPMFTPISNDDDSIIYSLIGVEGENGTVVSNGIITTDSKELRMIAMEGIATQYTYMGDSKVITAQMVDKDTHRIYFTSSGRNNDQLETRIAQNGIFITNTGQSNYLSWKRVDNIYEQSYNSLRYKFGFDQYSQGCYIEFPDNYAELIGDGIEIVYLILPSEDSDQKAQDIPAQTLTKFYVPVTPAEDLNMTLNTANVSISNYAQASGHKDLETINEAYSNYKKTVGTFKTLITLRDYLNYIKSKDLDICSNAFVCDRTNDIQTTYRIVSKQNGLDSLITNVEHIVDKTQFSSDFEYTFSISGDEDSIPGKLYYIIENDILKEVLDTTGGHPKQSGWYEFTSRSAKNHPALDAFSLKFYMLKKSILLNSKQAFNETFDLIEDKLNIDTLLADTAHLEHNYEDILPFGENSYKLTSDTTYLEHKAYYIKDSELNKFKLYTDYEVGDNIPISLDTIYEMDVEAMLPHIAFFKNIYPLVINISTYDNLNTVIQEEIQKNIISALYEGLNSSKLDFGEQINSSYIEEIIKTSDTRIRSVSFDPFNYTTRAVYYNGETFKSVELPSSLDYFEVDQKDENSIISHFIAKDIITKSILAGVTSLLIPDDIFSFHLNQKFINYFDNIYSITSQARIDIGGDDALITYSSDSSSPLVRKSYVLKPNEAIHLYRPQLENIREFSSGIHFEYFTYNDINAGQSYELQQGECIIFYQPNYTGEVATDRAPDGFSVFACTGGTIINPSFNILSQSNINTLSNFARNNVLPYFETNSSDNTFETSTYAYTYVTEIWNNSIIRQNGITGTNTINLQAVYEVTLKEEDNYKFFWSLKTPKYSNNNNIKSYTLFPKYDGSRNRLFDKEKNSYTLKAGEVLYYTDSSYSNLAILGEGTTIYRNCGVNSAYNDDNPMTCFEYVNIEEFTNGTNIRFKDGYLKRISNPDSSPNPMVNGWYEEGANPGEYIRTLDTSEQSGKDYYVLVMNDNAGLYKRLGDSAPYHHSSTLKTSNVFSEVALQDELCEINPKEENLYEIVSPMSSGIQDYYALSEGSSYDYYYRYTKTLDESVLSRKIFTSQDYSDIDISNINTYKTITIAPDNEKEFNYVENKLLITANGDDSYKEYYLYDSGADQYDRVEDILFLENPSVGEKNHTGERWFEKDGDTYVLTNDTRPKISTEPGSLEYPDTITRDYCFNEIIFDEWPSGNALDYHEFGYFRKYNEASSDYVFPEPTDNTFGRETNITLLSALMTVFAAAEETHGETSYTNVINFVIDNWLGNISCCNPFKTEEELGWRTKKFRPVESGETPTHYGFTNTDFRQIDGSSLEDVKIYPRFSLNIDYESPVLIDRVDIVIPITDIEIPEGIEPIELVEEDEHNLYTEIFDRTGAVSDKELCDYINNLNDSFRGLRSFCMEYPPRILQFKDFVRKIDKTYYKPDLYVEKNVGIVDAWACDAIDNDELAQDPIRVISGAWQSIQPNTSITIDQNEIWSFSEGDTLRFSAPVVTQKSLTWPVFGNTEIPLDLDKYTISYQRKGGSIEDLDNLILSGHQWQGYSQLLLNTSSKDGQKLESNHSIILYDDAGEEITTINGSDYENVSFQLKTTVSNEAGRYIDVTSSDIFGNINPNSVYEFVPLINNNEYYKYKNNDITYAIFDTELVTDNFYSIINSTVQIPMLLPKGDYLLPVYTATKGVNYWLTEYISARTPDIDNEEYCINMSPEYSSAINKTLRISCNKEGKHLYGYNKDETLGFKINNTEYNYLELNNDIFEDKIESYENIASTVAPKFGKNKYYNYDVEQNLYILLEEEPDDWDTNWFSYFIKEVKINKYRKVKLPAYITLEYFDDGSGTITKSPQDLQWYELNEDGHFELSTNTYVGLDLLEEVENKFDSYSWTTYTNPHKEGWYERMGVEGSYYYILTSDTKVTSNKNIFYEHISGESAPDFTSRDYYRYDSELDTYVLLRYIPEDWGTNWTDYFEKTIDIIRKSYYKDKDFYMPVEKLSDPVLKVNAENPLTSVTAAQVNIVIEDVFKYSNNPAFNGYLFDEIKDKIKQLDVDDKYNYAFRPDKNNSIEDPLIPISFFEKNHIFNNYIIPQLNFDNLYFRFPSINTRG